MNRPNPASRAHAVDVVRGAVMVLMVLDHVRVYAAVPSRSPEAAEFLTRWITHFCAPTFLFLAGVSAYLSGRRRTPSELARRLRWRGLFLVLLELVVIRTAWTFDLRFDEYLLAGVIWAIGWSMFLLSFLVRLSRTWLLAAALVIIGGHGLVASLLELGNPWAEDYAWPWRILYLGGLIEPTPDLTIVVLYSVVPWFALMLAGFGFGGVFALDPRARRRVCLAVGIGCLALFAVLRATNAFGDPRPWRASDDRACWIAFLDVSKYPPSLLFTLMTLGGTIAAIPLLEDARDAVSTWLAGFGRVPLFFYVVHIPLIHAVAILVSLVRTPDATGWLFDSFPVPYADPPEGYRYSLPLLYVVAIVVVVVLHFACRAYETLRAARRLRE